jgi:hypothetical protein
MATESHELYYERSWPNTVRTETKYHVVYKKSYAVGQVVEDVQSTDLPGDGTHHPNAPGVPVPFDCRARRASFVRRVSFRSSRGPSQISLYNVTVKLKPLNFAHEVLLYPIPQLQTQSNGRKVCDVPQPVRGAWADESFVHLGVDTKASSVVTREWNNGPICYLHLNEDGAVSRDLELKIDFNSSVIHPYNRLYTNPWRPSGTFSSYDSTPVVLHNNNESPRLPPMCDGATHLRAEEEKYVLAGTVKQRLRVTYKAVHHCLPSIRGEAQLLTARSALGEHVALYYTPNRDQSLIVTVPGHEVMVQEHRYGIIHPESARVSHSSANWFSALTHGISVFFGDVAAVCGFISNNLPNILFVLILASPLAGALPITWRVIFALGVWFAAVRADDLTDEKAMFRVTLPLYIHFLCALFRRESSYSPAATVASFVGLLYESGPLSAILTFAVIFATTRPKIVDIAASFAHFFGLWPTCLVHAIWDHVRLRAWIEEWARRTEEEVEDQFPRVRPWLAPAARIALSDLFEVRYHAATYGNFISATLQEFIHQSRRRTIARKQRRSPNLPVTDYRCLKNHFLYADEFRALAYHLSQLTKKDLKVFKSNLPTILTRKKWELERIRQAFERTSYGSIHLEPG